MLYNCMQYEIMIWILEQKKAISGKLIKCEYGL